MKKAFAWIACIALTSLITLAVRDYLTGDGELPEGVAKRTLHSDILKEDRDINIHFPPGYDSTEKYPVIYALDGGSEDIHIARTFDALARAGCITPAIVVGIPNMTAENRQYNLVPPFMRIDEEDSTSDDGNGNLFLDFMERELLPFIEKNYSVTNERMLSGNSRGGLLVMYSLIYKPELFSARFCYSTPFWRQNNVIASKVSQALTKRDTLDTFLYMSAGGNETNNIRNGLSEMKNTFEKQAPVALIWAAEITPNAVHQDNSRKSVARALKKWNEWRIQR